MKKEILIKNFDGKRLYGALLTKDEALSMCEMFIKDAVKFTMLEPESYLKNQVKIIGAHWGETTKKFPVSIYVCQAKIEIHIKH